ncbi:MAG TPA: DUF4185 domain-containing protein, partial [Thermoanaerobaculia bacterium]|jgi:hypothetical protein|nr:DUF4185 domain-containing protein [Thermoanaerobaculia bacterium]
VVLFRRSEEYARSCFDFGDNWLQFPDGLEEAEEVFAQQYMPGCELSSDPSAVETVRAPEQPPPPRIINSLCRGSEVVVVADLWRDARVTLFQGEQGPGFSEIGSGQAYDTVGEFQIEPLNPVRGHKVTAIQEICGLSSLRSDPAPVGARPHSLPTPGVPESLVECGEMVRVTNIARGARVDVMMTCVASPGRRLIGSKYVTAATEDIRVSPGLVADQAVYVEQHGCGLRNYSRGVPVLPLGGPLPRPKVHDGGDHLLVVGIIPGATAEVYLDQKYLDSGTSGTTEVVIPLAGKLAHGVFLQARQLLCGHNSGLGPELQVRNDVDKTKVTWKSTEWIAQLTGLRTYRAGVFGTDLGTSVDHVINGELRTFFFFGDTFTIGSSQSSDAIGWTTAAAPSSRGFRLSFPIDRIWLGLKMFRPLIIEVPGARTIADLFLSLSGFEVPTGAFSHAGKLYVFATTDHFTDTPRTPGKDENFMGVSVLATGSDPGRNFMKLYEISNRTNAPGGFKFINISPWKIRNDDWPGLPDNARPGEEGLLMVGSGRYRESPAFLAYVPLPPNADPPLHEWRYLSGFDDSQTSFSPCGRPSWCTQQAAAIPLFLEEPQVVGELSFSWNPFLNRWLLLYSGAVLRTAAWPWGPWTDPLPIFDFGRDNGAAFIDPDGGTYAPYVSARFNQWEPLTREATIYYVMSTWRPYQVSLMKTVLRLECEYRPCPNP